MKRLYCSLFHDGLGIDEKLRSKNGTTTVSYEYDGLGRRTKRTKGAEVIKYTYDGWDVIREDHSVNGITLYQNGLGVDDKLRSKNGNAVRYFLTDHLGSTEALADSSGTIVSSTSYDSFGNATSNIATTYRYTGREYDSDTGLYYYRNRWYDPEIGRFISEDPIGFAGGDINLYGYVGNNPLSFIDPFGFRGCPPRSSWGWDAVQLALGTAGMVPVFGEVFDAINAGISVARGNYADAVLDASSAIPFVGNIIGAGKFASRGIKLTRHGLNRKMNRGVKSLDELDAIRNPLEVRPVKIDSKGRPSQRIVGKKAEIVINPETGKIVSVNPTSRKKAARLKRKLERQR